MANNMRKPSPPDAANILARDPWKFPDTSSQTIWLLLKIEELEAEIATLKERRSPLGEAATHKEARLTAADKQRCALEFKIDFGAWQSVKAVNTHFEALGCIPSDDTLHALVDKMSAIRSYKAKDLATIWITSAMETKAYLYFLKAKEMVEYRDTGFFKMTKNKM